MSKHLDVMFARRLGHQLDGFEEKSQDKFVFRCPICGDSKTNKNKKRGAFMSRDSGLVFKCMNCSAGGPFSWFLKSQDAQLHNEYQLEKFELYRRPKVTVDEVKIDTAEQSTWLTDLLNSGNVVIENVGIAPVLDATTITLPPRSPIDELRRMDDLPAGHPADQYMHERGFHKGSKAWNDLRWCENFPAWRNKHASIEETPLNGKEGRIILPLVSADGVVYGAQGRKISGVQGLRYITTIFDKRVTVPCYGAHLADFTEEQDVWVCEGGLDALSLSNAIASLHADLGAFSERFGLDKSSTVLLFDNEPGNREVRQNVSKAIDLGWRIAFWTRRQAEVGKDANDAVMVRGRKPEDLFVIKTGIAAKLEFSRWTGRLS